MQDFKVHSYVEFYESLPEEHQQMVSLLCELVHENIPDVKEKLSFNVPFFSKNKSICYIWPGSVPWGKKIKEGVEFGFTKGFLMGPNDYLEKGNRKQVYLKTFYSLNEIAEDLPILESLLREALVIDQNKKPEESY